jgi:hypothetical protein
MTGRARHDDNRKLTRVAERGGMKGFDVEILPGDFGPELCARGRKCVKHCHAGHDLASPFAHDAQAAAGPCHDGDCWPA